MIKRWQNKETPSTYTIEELSKAINVNPYLSTILLQRGISDFNAAKDFFRPSLEKLHNPFLMQDMEKAVRRLKKAVDNAEKILIYGDYDVDGTTAVSLVYSYLRKFYSHCEIYIPDRYAEGYGVSQAGVEWAAANNYSLIIIIFLFCEDAHYFLLFATILSVDRFFFFSVHLSKSNF